MNTVFERLNPEGKHDVIWEPQVMRESGMLPPEIEDVKQRFNSVHTSDLIAYINGEAKHGIDEMSGMAHTTYVAEGDSTDTLVVHGNPFMNGMSDNMKLRGLFIYEGLKALGIHDDEGRPLPVMSLGRPDATSRMRFSADAAQNRRILRGEIRHGNFQPVGRLDLEAVRRAHPKVGKIARIGFSLDACIAPTEAVLAPSMQLDMTHLVIGDPVNVVPRKDRGPFKLALGDFAAEGDLLKPATERAGIEPFIDLHDTGIIPMYWGIAKSIIPVLGTDWWLGHGMAHDTFGIPFKQALRMEVNATVGLSNKGAVSPLVAGMKAVNYARQQSGRDVYTVQFGDQHDETHCIGDQLDVMTTFYGYGLSR